MKNDVAPPPGSSIGISRAVDITSNWRKVFSIVYPNADPFRGFYIPIKDIHDLADYYDAEGVRGYICLDKPEDIQSIRMILVPVKDGKDIVENFLVDDDEYTSVYDFTQPCPTQCDQTSILY